MEALPVDAWTAILRYIQDTDVVAVSSTSTSLRSRVLWALRELHSQAPFWTNQLFARAPALRSLTSHATISNWSILSQLPRALIHFKGGYISGQNAPDFSGSILQTLEVISPFISWTIVNSLPQTLTKFVLQECRYFTDELFAILPRSLTCLRILACEQKCQLCHRREHYNSTSFITDMAMLDLPPLITDLALHSSRPFSDAALKLIRQPLVSLRLSPTVFTSTGLAGIPSTIQTLILPNQKADLAVPPESKIANLTKLNFSKLASIPLDSLRNLPADLTYLSLKACQQVSFQDHLLQCTRLVVLKLESLDAEAVELLPRTLQVLHAPKPGLTVVNDLVASYFPPSIIFMHIYAHFHAPSASVLPQSMRSFQLESPAPFEASATPTIITNPLADLLAEEPFDCIDEQEFTNMTLLHYLHLLKGRRLFRLANSSHFEWSGTNYPFSEREHDSISSATLRHLFVEGHSLSRELLPRHLVSLKIKPSSGGTNFIGKWTFPPSLESLVLDSMIFGYLDSTPSGILGDSSDDVPVRPKSDQDDASDFVPLEYPPNLTSLDAGCFLGPIVSLPSTLTTLSFHVPRGYFRLLWLALNNLPASLTDLIVRSPVSFLAPAEPAIKAICYADSTQAFMADLISKCRAWDEKYPLPEPRATFKMPSLEEEALEDPEHPPQVAPDDFKDLDGLEVYNLDEDWPSKKSFKPPVAANQQVIEDSLRFEFWALFACLPPSITTLSYYKMPSVLADYFSVIPHTLEQLSLDGDDFVYEDGPSLRSWYQKPPPDPALSKRAKKPTKAVPDPIEPQKHFHKRGHHTTRIPPPNDPPCHPMDATLTDENVETLHSEASLTSLRLYMNTTLTKKGFEKLPAGLSTLVVSSNRNIDDETFSILPRTLTHLAIGSASITDACIDGLPQNLAVLDLGSDLTNAVISRLPRSITHLFMRRNVSWTDEALLNLPPNLLKLNLNQNMKITDVGLRYLPRSLVVLALYSNKLITDLGIPQLPPQLTELWLSSNTNIGNQNIHALPRSLLLLALNATPKITGHAFSMLPPYLTRLHLDTAKVSEEDLKNLPRCIARLRVSVSARSADIYSHLPLLQYDPGFVVEKSP